MTVVKILDNNEVAHTKGITLVKKGQVAWLFIGDP